MLKEGWLNRQSDQVSKNIEKWPDWMKRAAGLENSSTKRKTEKLSKDDKTQSKLDLK